MNQILYRSNNQYVYDLPNTNILDHNIRSPHQPEHISRQVVEELGAVSVEIDRGPHAVFRELDQVSGLPSAEEIMSYDYLGHITRELPPKCRIPLLDHYRIKSKINNLPREISCSTDLCFRRRILKAIYFIPRFIQLFNIWDYIFIALVIGITVVCVRYNITYQPDVGSLITIILFPLTYTLGDSFTRRSDMLSSIADIRSTNIKMITQICQINAEEGEKFKKISYTLILRLREHLADCREYSLTHNETNRLYYLDRIYCRINQIGWLIYHLTNKLQKNLKENLGALIDEFEQYRIGVDYQTVVSLSYYMRILIVVNIILLTPWFASFIKALNGFFMFGYLLTVSIVISLIGLHRIHNQLENPFGNDWDDINIHSMLNSHLYLESFHIWDKDGNVNKQRMRYFCGGDIGYHKPIN